MKGYTAPSRIRSVIAVMAVIAAVIALGFVTQQRREAKQEQIRTDAVNVAADVSATTGKILGAFPSVSGDKAGRSIRTVTWGGDGIPNNWCENHPGACDNIRDKASIVTIGWQPFGHNPDNVNHGNLPDRWENPVRNHMSGGVAKGDGGYDDMVDLADCAKDGYGCWDTPNHMSELADWEEVVIACAGSVVITTIANAVPVVGPWLALGPAQSRCFWGTVGYFIATD